MGSIGNKLPKKNHSLETCQDPLDCPTCRKVYERLFKKCSNSGYMVASVRIQVYPGLFLLLSLN